MGIRPVGRSPRAGTDLPSDGASSGRQKSIWKGDSVGTWDQRFESPFPPAERLFVPQLIFVPLLQAVVNRRTGARIRVLRQLGIAMIDRTGGAEDEQRIDQAFKLDMGIFKVKFTMNFLMNVCNYLQRVSALLIGGWWVYTNHLEIGGVVAFISGIRDPWGDLVNYFRDVNITQVKYRVLTAAVDELTPTTLTPIASNGR